MQRKKIIPVKEVFVVAAIFAVIALFLMISIHTKYSYADSVSGRYDSGKLTWSFAGDYSSETQNKLIKYPKQWIALSSKLSMTKGDNYKYSKFRVRYCLTAPPEEGLLGRTYYFTKEGTPLSLADKWWKATCSVYKVDNLTTTNKHATLTHEAGHALSMYHCSHKGENHIMHIGRKNYTAISSFDKNVLQKKWGK